MNSSRQSAIGSRGHGFNGRRWNGIIVFVTVVRCHSIFWLSAGMCVRDLAQ